MNKKILIVIHSLSTGGAERQVVSDANLLSRHGHAVTVAFHLDGMLRQDLDAEVGIRRIKHKNEIAALLQLAFYLHKNRFDIVFAHMFWAHKASAFPSWLAGSKYVFFEHGLGLKRKWYHVALLRLLDRFANKIATASKAKIEIKIKRENTSRDKLIAIPNCFSQSRSLNEPAKRRSFAEKGNGIPEILFVGRFNKVKQLDLLIDAAQKMLEQKAEFRFILCGDGPEFAHILSRIKELNLENYFTLPGFVSNSYEYLFKGDIFVLPSRSEDFSVALLEAGFAGLPAVAFAVGGNGEIVVDGETGFLIEPYDLECFVEKLLFLLKNTDKRRQMGEKARARVLASFSEVQRLERLESLIHSL